MTSARVDDMKDERVPASMFWKVEDVANWIEGLGYPHYKVRFCTDRCLKMPYLDFLGLLAIEFCTNYRQYKNVNIANLILALLNSSIN